jgi:hypothetical protein
MEQLQRFSGKDQMRVMNGIKRAAVNADLSQFKKFFYFPLAGSTSKLGNYGERFARSTDSR